MNKTYGYVRVSTKEQNTHRQVAAMLNFGISGEMIITEKKSGKDFDRPQYQKLIRRLKKNDTLVVKSIDRLGRNYAEIIEQWRLITKEKHANIVVLDIPLLDTRTKPGNLTGAFISDLVLQILSYVAESERENIRQRQAEGIAAAKERGVRFGRPCTAKPRGYKKVIELYSQGEVSSRKAAEKLGISQCTFLQWAAEDKGQTKQKDFNKLTNA